MRHHCFLTTRWLAVLAAWGFLSGLGAPPARAQTSPYTPYQHRAWYIYLIAQYTVWPESAFPPGEESFVVGILGDNPFGDALQVIEGKPIKKRKLVVRQCQDLEAARTCHALYICDSERDRLPEIMAALGQAPILTFSETPAFLKANGIVKLWVKDETPSQGYLYFEINQAAATRLGLRINAHVLNLAKPQPRAP